VPTKELAGLTAEAEPKSATNTIDITQAFCLKRAHYSDAISLYSQKEARSLVVVVVLDGSKYEIRLTTGLLL